MTQIAALDCQVHDRRRKLFGNKDWNGIDYLDVADDQMSLCVHFFGHISPHLTIANVRIHGGRRITDVRAVRVEIDPSNDADLDDCLRITLNHPGDFSTYTLCLEDCEGQPYAGLDPRYACLDFSFKLDCPSDLDCKAADDCPPLALPEPDINYLAKDYASFRQLIYDRLALIMPDWQERHVPDLGVTLVEILAYVGDYLSYYQDAVATEAYLDTARQRVSVRRHLKLIDYHLNEGCNARAFVAITTTDEQEFGTPDQFAFITGFPDIKTVRGNVIESADLERVPSHLYQVFEPVGDGPFKLYPAHNEIRFYSWGDSECCLAKGTTRATLFDHDREYHADAPTQLHLKPCDLLIFEELRGPITGVAADADPAHRHVVRLTSVTKSYDALLKTMVVEIEWAQEDALPFTLCLSARRPAPDCDWIRDISVARGNVVLVDHGRSHTLTLDAVPGRTVYGDCACEGSIIESRSEALPFTPVLPDAPLTFAEPVPACAPATQLIIRDAGLALSAVRLSDASGFWQPCAGLLGSGAEDRHFVAETDDEGRAHLRFGDGRHGRQPETGSIFTATYRSGTGPSGNVGRDAISYLLNKSGTIGATTISVRNPIAASGGSLPEPVAEAKLTAPGTIFARRERAIIADDYAELAQRNTKLQGAAAALRWTGSWHEAHVALDPAHSATADPALIARVTNELQRYRRIGHDLAVVGARSVPLRLAVKVYVLAHYARGQVKAALLDAFSNRSLAGGKIGFFHPDNLRFGGDVYLSQIVAAAMAVEGIETVEVTKLERLNLPDAASLAVGFLAIDPSEIAILDNDPDFPENGQLVLDMGGGQ